MKYLGIDFGTKRIGIAVSDETGSVAFPRQVIEARGAFQAILDLIASEGVESVVVGRSRAQDGSNNPVESDIKKFCADLESHTGLPVHRQDESFSSVEAVRHHFAKKPVANPRRGGEAAVPTAPHDHSAAAIILQRYLDRAGASTLPDSQNLED